jgi:hypothetical protein
MSERPSNKRIWLLSIALGASLVANLALAVKIIVFDPILPLKPVCFTEDDGLVVLDRPMTNAFKRRMALAYHSSPRASMSGWRLYVSRWYWWNEKEVIWNHSRQAAEDIYQKAAPGRPLPTDPLRRSSTCWFIAKYALK